MFTRVEFHEFIQYAITFFVFGMFLFFFAIPRSMLFYLFILFFCARFTYLFLDYCNIIYAQRSLYKFPLLLLLMLIVSTWSSKIVNSYTHSHTQLSWFNRLIIIELFRIELFIIGCNLQTIYTLLQNCI